MLQSLRELLDLPEPVLAPLALNPLMARLADKAGFPAVYLGGGALGYDNVFVEANLNATDMAHAGLNIASATSKPIILDGACGWGDPMHLHRTIALAEAAGFAAIEIEDQLYPKRVHHHVGTEHMVPQEFMEAKIRQAVDARRNPDFLIIARTNAAGAHGDPDDALRRSEGYRRAGADVLMPAPGNVTDPEVLFRFGEELGGPLMFLCPPGGVAEAPLTLDELASAGYKLIVDGTSLFLVVYTALKAGYAELADGFSMQREPDSSGWWEILDEVHETIDLDALLEVEKVTVEHG